MNALTEDGWKCWLAFHENHDQCKQHSEGKIAGGRSVESCLRLCFSRAEGQWTQMFKRWIGAQRCSMEIRGGELNQEKNSMTRKRLHERDEERSDGRSEWGVEGGAEKMEWSEEWKVHAVFVTNPESIRLWNRAEYPKRRFLCLTHQVSLTGETVLEFSMSAVFLESLKFF